MIYLKNDFKTIQIALYLTDLDDRASSVYRFLLPKLLTSHTDRQDTRLKMSMALEQLYGAYFKTRVDRFANLSVMSMVLTIVDPGIVQDPTLLKEALILFRDVLFSHQTFSEEIFLEEKRMLIEQWETLKDKKRLYAQTRFYEHFFGEDLYGYPLSGTLEDIKKLTLDDMIAYYHQIMKQSPVSWVINGPLNEGELESIKQYLMPERPCGVPFETVFRAPRPLIRLEEETNDMKQPIIKLGYHFGIFRHDPLYDAAVIAETVLGGYPESRLFKEIREEKGLCYDIGSNYDYYKGFLMIAAGVEATQKDYAIDETIKLVETLKRDGITELELLHAKKYVSHQIKSSLDSQSVLTRRAFIRHLLNYSESVEERLKDIESVSVEDVRKALEFLILDTIYVLKEGSR